MGKKLIWLLAIAILLLFGSWLLYRKLARVASPGTPVASHWPTPSPPPPANSTAPAAPQPVTPEAANKKEAPPPEPVFALRPGETLEYDANIAKLLASEACWHAGEAAMQTHGGFAFAREFDVERKWRECRVYQIAPVSTNLILAYLGHKVLGMPKSYGGIAAAAAK